MALPHVVLGISPNATMHEVTAAYRSLAQKHHPDRAGGDAARFLQIKQAFEALRAKHDATGPFDDIIAAAADNRL